MESGILLTIVFLILAVIAGIILIVFGISFISAGSALNFGFKCYFAFAEYNVLGYLNGINTLASTFLAGVPFGTPPSATGVQTGCAQSSNLNGGSVAQFGQQIYAKAASCYNLFQGSNTGAGQSILNNLNSNGFFQCYSGTVLNSETTQLTNYSDIINYIDTSYPNTGGQLQIVFITNGSNGIADYVRPSAKIFNDSRYVIQYFGFSGSLPNSQNCTLTFSAQCGYVSQYDQPDAAQGCSYQNESVIQAAYPVSSLVNSNPNQENPPTNAKIEQCGNYNVAFCGILLNSMLIGQNRVFVCITNQTLG